MIKQLKKLMLEQYSSHKSFYRYLFISILVTGLDIVTSRACEIFTTIIIANSIGIITGFIVQYFLTAQYVYHKKNIGTFIKFLLTFLLGFTLANVIVYVCRILIFSESTSLIAFMISKGLSIVIPFFVMYFIRKHWIENSN